MKALSEAEIDAELAALDGWTLGPEGIRKRYALGTFEAAMQLVGRVADLAYRSGRPPDILIHGGNVTFTLTTVAAGGVTRGDLELAAQIEAISP